MPNSELLAWQAVKAGAEAYLQWLHCIEDRLHLPRYVLLTDSVNQVLRLALEGCTDAEARGPLLDALWLSRQEFDLSRCIEPPATTGSVGSLDASSEIHSVLGAPRNRHLRGEIPLSDSEIESAFLESFGHAVGVHQLSFSRDTLDDFIAEASAHYKPEHLARDDVSLVIEAARSDAHSPVVDVLVLDFGRVRTICCALHSGHCSS